MKTKMCGFTFQLYHGGNSCFWEGKSDDLTHSAACGELEELLGTKLGSFMEGRYSGTGMWPETDREGSIRNLTRLRNRFFKLYYNETRDEID